MAEAPFDSMRKMMTTIHQTADGRFIQFTKGAPDEVLKRCTKGLCGRTDRGNDRRNPQQHFKE